MLSELVPLASEWDADGGLGSQIRSARWAEDRLILEIALRGDSSDAALFSVECAGVREHRLSLDWVADGPSLHEDHVLLWPHARMVTAISFVGRVDDPEPVVGGLYATHRRLVGGWPVDDGFASGLAEPTKLLARGFGILAEGPEPLIREYGEVLQGRGIEHSLLTRYLPRRWDGQRWVDEPVFALVVGRSFVVASGFREERIELDAAASGNSPAQAV